MDETSKHKRQDLRPVSFGHLHWSEAEKIDSLNTVFSYAVNHANEVIDWYLLSKRRKKQCASYLRIVSILLTTIAVLIPIIAEICDCIPAIWATVFFAIAATCVAFDRFFGCSSSWMRYMAAEHKVRQLLHEFEIDREVLKVEWEDSGPEKGQIVDGLKAAKTFIIKIDDVVKNETEQWRAEFQGVIKDIDKATKSNKIKDFS